MKTKLFAAICAAAVLAVAITFAQDNDTTKKEKPDARIDKLIEQNEQILKNQQEILQKLEKIDQGLLQVRRRTS